MPISNTLKLNNQRYAVFVYKYEIFIYKIYTTISIFYFKNGIDEAFDFDVDEINNEKADDDLAALIESSRQVNLLKGLPPLTSLFFI